MGWERQVALTAAGLAAAVTIAMCIGLSDDEASGPSRRAPDESVGAADLEPDPDPEPEWDTASDEELADEPEDPSAALDGERTLVGTVTDERDELLEGAEVTVEGFSRLRDITDEEGNYQLHSVPNDASTLVVQVTGYADERVSLEPGEPDSRQRVDVQLADGDGVAGVVLDPAGEPVDGARVSCAGRREPDLQTQTDRYGRFQLSKLAAGCDGIAHHSSHGDSPRVELRSGAGNLIALALQGTISGLVVDGRGHPVRSFVIELEEFRPEGDAPGKRRYRQPYANPRGRFTVRGLAPGTYVFSVAPQSGSTVRTKPIRVKSGEQVRDVRVVVR